LSFAPAARNGAIGTASSGSAGPPSRHYEAEDDYATDYNIHADDEDQRVGESRE
jgi:hypothetical protein